MCAAKSKEREVDHLLGQQDLDDLDRDLLQDPDWYQKELENIKKAELRQDWELKRRLLVHQIEQIEQDIVKSQASLLQQKLKQRRARRKSPSLEPKRAKQKKVTLKRLNQKIKIK